MTAEHRQGKGDTLTKFIRDGDKVTITSRRMGYPITMHITPELLDFLALEGYAATTTKEENTRES